MKLKKMLLRIAMRTGIALVLMIVAIALFMNLHPVFGGEPDTASQERIDNSIHFNGERFVNLVHTAMTPGQKSEYNVSLWDFFFPRDGKHPMSLLPNKPLNTSALTSDTFVWIGHATILMKTGDTTILTDPVFHRASPVPIAGDPFDFEHDIEIEDLPNIDIVVISHDHYDHLDYKAVKKLDSKVNHYVVPLGVKAHFQRWGISEQKISEFDWYEQQQFDNIQLTFAPSRHFSGRGLTNQRSTQWGSWIITSPSQNIYFSGDSGYFEEFRNIGETYGPFDVVFLDNGAYDRSWQHVHMMPEETVQASIDLQSSVLVPINWAKFDLAFHPWNEPAMRVTSEAKRKNVTVATPLMGEVFTLDSIPQTAWWEDVS